MVVYSGYRYCLIAVCRRAFRLHALPVLAWEHPDIGLVSTSRLYANIVSDVSPSIYWTDMPQLTFMFFCEMTWQLFVGLPLTFN